MRIDLDCYQLSESEYSEMSIMLASLDDTLDLESLWSLMDQVWVDVGCASQPLRSECLEAFYRHPIWTLNGIFIEQDPVSMAHRRAFADALSTLAPQKVIEIGGGFGTLARLLTNRCPEALISLFEPYPSDCMLNLCSQARQINFISQIELDTYDTLICTDVLEHIEAPIDMLVNMIAAVRIGGNLLIANCFEPVVACHLPSTFHLRYSFDELCLQLGLRKIDSIKLPYGAIYQKIDSVLIDKQALRHWEAQSKRLFPFRVCADRLFSPLTIRLDKVLNEPMYYLGKFAAALRKR